MKAKEAITRVVMKMKNNQTHAGALMLGATAASATVLTSFADTTEAIQSVTTAVTDIGGSLFTGICTISAIVAGIVFAYCMIRMIMAKNEKDVEVFKKWAIRAFICAVLLFCAPGVVSIAGNIGKSLNTSLGGSDTLAPVK